MASRTTVVYGDLNCPFCYALEERLLARDAALPIEWRLVEHMPGLPIVPDSAHPDELEHLAGEVAALAERARDVRIRQPPFRPNTRRAIRAVAEACELDPPRAWALRSSLFRALWRDGRNIADPAIIESLVARVGLPPQRGTAGAAELADRWTHEWRDSKLDRIPVMISEAGTKLLGLPPLRRLEMFLASGLFTSSFDLVCDVDDEEHAASPPHDDEPA